jgi:hypothetical protein
MRQQLGSDYQEEAAAWIVNKLNGMGNLSSISSIARMSTRSDDLRISTASDGDFTVEIKGISNPRVGFAVVDGRVTRQKVPQRIEDAYQRMSKVVDVGGARLDKIVGDGNFISMIDYFRANIDPTVGLSGDRGSAKSGKLPNELVTMDSSTTKSFRNEYLKTLISKKISVICLVSKDGMRAYHTGHGKNIMELQRFPKFSKVRMTTFGNPEGPATRIAVKAYL